MMMMMMMWLWSIHDWCVSMQAVADSIPQLVQGMRSSQAQPEELGAQLTLIMASQTFLQVRPTIMTQSATVPLSVIRYTRTNKNVSCLRSVVVFLSPWLSLAVRWWRLQSQQFPQWRIRLLLCNWDSVSKTWLPALLSSGRQPWRYLTPFQKAGVISLQEMCCYQLFVVRLHFGKPSYLISFRDTKHSI